MKAKRNLLIGIILGAVIGWVSGFLRLPYIENNYSFLLGFIACFAIIVLVCYVVFLWNKKSSILRLIGKTNETQVSKITARKYNIIWMLLIFFLATGGMISNVYMHKQNALLITQIQDQNKNIKELSEMIESAGAGNLTSFMNMMLDEVDHALKTNPGVVLSDTIIEKIAALSLSFKPYKYFEGDSISEKKMSPERGQLLLALLLMDIDSVSFSKIKSNVTFSGANLNGVDLKGADLSNADLKGAHFKETNLSGTNFNHADLSDAELYAANLDSANFSGADLKRSDLRWAQLNDAELSRADMNGAQMASAQFINANLYKAKIQFADLTGAILHKANLSGVDLMGTGLTKANLSEADLSNTDLRMIKPDEAILNGAEFNKAIVDSTWMKNLNIWRLIGINEIRDNYKIINDTADQWKKPIYRLKKIDD